MKTHRLKFCLLSLFLAALCIFSACTGGSAAEPVPSASVPEGSTLQVYCFQAGKADAILLWTNNGAVLIDAGLSGFGKEIVSFLAAQGISALDYLILTHFDADHIGGAAKVLNSVSVKNVLQSDCPKDSNAYDKYVKALDNAGLTAQTVRQVLSFTLDSVVYTVDPPQKTTYSTDPSNNSSLIVSAQYGTKRFLFCGDAENARLGEFLSGDNGTYDFLKVPYHGHWQETLPALFAAVSPAYAVITSSDEEQEDAETSSALEDTGTQVFLTRESPVLAVCDGTTLTVSYASAKSSG